MESSPKPHRITVMLALLAASVSATGVYISYKAYVLNVSKQSEPAVGASSALPSSAKTDREAPSTESASQPAAEHLNLAGRWSANSAHYTIITQSGDRIKLDTYYTATRSLRITCEGVLAGESLEVDCSPNPAWQAPQREHYIGHFTGVVQSGGRGIVFTGYPQGYKLQWGIER